jgi:hypothetical protein
VFERQSLAVLFDHFAGGTAELDHPDRRDDLAFQFDLERLAVELERDRCEQGLAGRSGRP